MSVEKLLVHPRAFADESIPGYLLRLAELNGFKRPSALFEGAGIRFNGPSQLHISLTDAAMQTSLAVFINRPAAELYQLAYRFIKSTKRPDTIAWGQLNLPASSMRTMNSCVCSHCLKDSEYARQEWDWAFSTACPRHGCLLLDVCPGCSNRISRYRAGVSRCNCGFDFRLASSEPCSAESSSYFQSLVSGRKRDCGDVSANLAVWASVAYATTESEPQDCDASGLIGLPIGRQNAAMMAAYTAIQSGDIAGLIGKSAGVRFANFKALGPRYAVYPFVGLVESQPYILEGEALALIIGALTVAPNDMCSPSVLKVGLSTKELAFILNISERMAAELATNAVLSTTNRDFLKERRNWLFDSGSVVNLLEKLRQIAPRDIGHSVYTVRDIELPTRPTPITGCSQLIRAILLGEVRVVEYAEDIGLPSLRFQAVREATASKPEGLSIADCANALNIYSDAIYRVVRANLLPASKVGRSFSVGATDFAAFRERYVFVKELASSLKVSSTNLAEKLMHVGVVPVSGPRIDGGLVYLFERADLAEVDLTAAASSKGYATLTGRTRAAEQSVKNEGYLRTVDAAKTLGLSTQAIGVLVRKGLLTEHRPDGNLSNTRFFRDSEIEAYREKFRTGSSHVPLDDAVAWLSAALPMLSFESPKYFRKRWVDSGKIEIHSDGFQDYVQTSDLEKIRDERMMSVSPKEAAELLNVNRATLANWVKMGRLTPTSGPQIDGSRWNSFSRVDVEALRSALMNQT